MKALRADLFTALPLERQRQREWRKEEKEGPRKTLSLLRTLNRTASRKTEWPRLNATVAHAGWARSQSWICHFLICTQAGYLHLWNINPACSPPKNMFSNLRVLFFDKKTNKTKLFFFFLECALEKSKKAKSKWKIELGEFVSLRYGFWSRQNYFLNEQRGRRVRSV